VGAGNLYVIRSSDNAVVDTVALGSYVNGLTMLPNGNRLYVAAGQQSDRIYVISLPDNSVEDSILVGQHVDEVAALPGGRFVYASSYRDSTVCVIRTSDDSLVERIPLGFGPSCLTIHPGGVAVYVADEDNGGVAVIGY
jgi:DNA-binding beta-propeller fold protein YncE